MITAHWNKPGLWEQGTVATAWIRNGIGTARLRIKDQPVFETHGGEFNTRTEWKDERTGIVDLAVILCMEAFERGEVDLSHYILGGFNTATIIKSVAEPEKPASVMYESWKLLRDLEAGHQLCQKSIEELQLDMFRTPEVGPQLELFG